MTYKADLEAAAGFLKAGNYKRAMKAAQSAAKKSPKSHVAHNLAGIATSASGRPRDAVAHFQKALKLQPDFADAQKNLAQCLLLLGRADAALGVLDKLAIRQEGDWQVWSLKAQAELGLGRETLALASVEHAVALAPSVGSNRHLQSTILLALGRIKDAIAALEAALEIDPGDVTALTNLSLPLARQAQSDAALAVVEKAVSLAPENAPARFRLATQLVEMGRTEEGIAVYQRLLKDEPTHAVTLERLAALLDGESRAELERPIRSALALAPRNSEERASLFFALSHVLAESGGGEAEKMLSLANRELAKIQPYDAESDAKVTEAILGRFPLEPPLETGQAAGPYPIFVLGLPRSGTTLVEAILGAHPEIAPLGERGTMGFLLREIIEQDRPLSAEMAVTLREEDQRLLPDLPSGTRAYVDKMPENYRLVGFLKAIYPDARIVNVQRDPRDVALSMWKSHFSGSVLSYSYDWAWMAQKFNLYARSMRRWQALHANEMLELRYEALVADVEGEGRRLAEFCGIHWQAAMARPDLSTSQVLTLSATQLRRPVTNSSVGKWRGKDELIEPFVQRLDPDLWAHYLAAEG